MTEVARVTFKVEQLKNSAKFASGSLGSLLENAVAGLDDQARAKIEASGECTVVYHGCGTCADGGALVEYYCSGGGSQPDYTRCESCD